MVTDGGKLSQLFLVSPAQDTGVPRKPLQAAQPTSSRTGAGLTHTDFSFPYLFIPVDLRHTE